LVTLVNAMLSHARLRAGNAVVEPAGSSPDDDASDCADAGMDGFLVKPVDLARLRAILDGEAAVSSTR
jgi:CheY-like chemotaxis protein